MNFRKTTLVLFGTLLMTGIFAEDAATESDVSGWDRTPVLSTENPRVGKNCVRSGAIKGNYPGFTLTFPAKNMEYTDAEVTLYWKADTNAARWLPELRLLDKQSGGFLHWRPTRAFNTGNMGWEKVTVQVGAMAKYKEVDLKNITGLSVVGYQVISPPGEPLFETEFFVDGLEFALEKTLAVTVKAERPYAFRRMSGNVEIPVTVSNAPADAELKVTLTGETKSYPVSGDATVGFKFDTSLKPGSYPCRLELAGASQDFELYIAPREVPHWMPVVMWGHGEIDLVQPLGFTHNFITYVEGARIFEAGASVPPNSEKTYENYARTFDKALINGYHIAGYVCPGRCLFNAKYSQFQRVEQNGQPYSDTHGNCCAMFPEVQKFAYSVGVSYARTYGKFAALDLTMVESETRDGTRLCYHPHDLEAYEKETGRKVPMNVKSKFGLKYTQIPNFPADRVIKDDDPILHYLQWFWQRGDGWNEVFTQTHKGLQTGPHPIPTWYDPAVRVPSTSGSGGSVDYISQWTYTYPDPIKIGKATDELFAMAALNPRGNQQVMKMTQIIWYRSPTAPVRKPGVHDNIPVAEWETREPDAKYITIAPDHLSIAFWSMVSRPVQGIMYHGLWSLDDKWKGNRWSYCYTNSETKVVLKNLIDTVVTPLGPTLKQIPDLPADVAFLQSFTSEMFAGVGEFGWGHGWTNDAYQILRYARLQPKVVYEESLLKGALSGVKVLTAVNCPVITASTAKIMKQFQRQGGIIIGDENLAPAITPDIVLTRYNRTKNSDKDKAVFQQKAAALTQELKGSYAPYAVSSDPDIMVRVRRYKDCDYLFVYNDKRTYGDYVGQFGLVMEKGLPVSGTVSVSKAGTVYDLINHQKIDADSRKGFEVKLGPGEGKVFMISPRPMDKVMLSVPASVARGGEVPVEVSINVTGIVPLQLTVTDPQGGKSEFSGYYGVKDGQMRVILNIAANDAPGEWHVEATELASGKSAAKSFTVK